MKSEFGSLPDLARDLAEVPVVRGHAREDAVISGEQGDSDS